MTQLTAFLDIGGVINDKDQQVTQWQRLVGSCFVLLLGGTAEGWIEANHLVTERLLELERVQAMANFVSFYWTYQLNWVRGMCALQNLPIPSVVECPARFLGAALPGLPLAGRVLPGRVKRLASFTSRTGLP